MTKSNDSLLTPEEQSACEKISQLDTALQSRRASALLAINEGITQVKAAQSAELSIGQVRYCLKRFRESRMDIFSVGQQDQTTQVETAAAVIQETEPETPVPQVAQKPAKTGKSKKSKSGKDKKTKKDSGKKPGKGKKSDKKSGKNKSDDKKSKKKKQKNKDKKKGKKDKKSKKKSGKSKKGKKSKK